MVTISATVLLALLVAWRLLAPFDREKVVVSPTQLDEDSSTSLSAWRREFLLQELEFDHATGAIDSEDLPSLRAELESPSGGNE